MNGTVGLAIVPHGQLIGALAFTVEDDKVTMIEGITDPDRLRRVDLAALGT